MKAEPQIQHSASQRAPAPARSLHPRYPARRRFEYVFLFGLVAVAVFCGAVTYRSLRVMQTEQRLIELGAQYQWNHEVNRSQTSQTRRSIDRSLVNYFGKPAVSNFASVRLANGDPEDSQLQFLSGMKQLTALELQSNKATDRTLDIISKLPDLRYLSLAGNRFSVFGLLQLRNARSLKQLEIDTTLLSPIELAVLRSELTGVMLQDLNAQPDPRLPKIGIATEPAA
ncbi:MAG: hypothetical protein NXI32_05925 [bacterium]|nr:hypothetical protein [bacterium]